MTEAEIRTRNGLMRAYGAVPAGAGPWPGVLVVLNMLSGNRYHEPSAQDAHCRIAVFFHRHLTAP